MILILSLRVKKKRPSPSCDMCIQLDTDLLELNKRTPKLQRERKL